ncbi:hypothetical protein AB0L99_44840 [Streptomyces sp. NPDC051954]|uniref:hypothetical protein n=1 Tax=unclassified Streptomyces TaxID=2593676 RepID=UPI00341E18BD
MTAMTTRERRRTWAVFVAAMATAACGAGWMIATWDEVDSNGVSVHKEEKSPEEIRKFWTPERMREAKPG